MKYLFIFLADFDFLFLLFSKKIPQSNLRHIFNTLPFLNLLLIPAPDSTGSRFFYEEKDLKKNKNTIFLVFGPDSGRFQNEAEK